MVGCGVFSTPAAKSRAAVAGWGPRMPSLTAVTLALSFGGSVEWASESDPTPPRERRSWARFRADEAFNFSLSIRPFENRKTARKRAIVWRVSGEIPQA